MSADREVVLRQEANAAMAAYARGDDSAFRRLYELVGDRVYAYVFRRISDAPRAEDLMQQTFLHLHRARGTYDARNGVLPWLYAIAHNLVVDHARRGSREEPMDPDGGVPEMECPAGAADEQLIAGQLQRRFEETLRNLPEKQRAAYELIHQEGLSYQEAAQALALSVSSVTSLLHRARTALQEAIEEEPD